jgi:hypothetical protein
MSHLRGSRLRSALLGQGKLGFLARAVEATLFYPRDSMALLHVLDM